MSHSSKCFGRHDVPLNLFSSRVPVMCDMKTRSYQYSIPFLPEKITCSEACWAAIATYYTSKSPEKWGEYNSNKGVTCHMPSHVTHVK